MTIQEAIKSGKWFHRIGRRGVEFKAKGGDLLRKPEGGPIFSDGMNVLNMKDLLADDWEVEREPREWIAYVSASDEIVAVREKSGHFKLLNIDVNEVRVREVLD